MLNLEGTGLIGVPGTAERVFASLRTAQVSVVMISQGSSEHSICCVVKQHESERARNALLQAFAHELTVGQVQRVQLTTGISVLAAVGDGMAGQPGVAARLFESLGRAHVNILAIAQGSSERNISVAIDAAHATKALRAAHAGFWLSPQTFSVGVIGPGNVGAALLDQLRVAQPQLLGKANLDLRLRAVVSRGRMLLDERGLVGDWRDAFASAATPTDLERFTTHLLSAHLPHTVIIDCSGSAEVADRYAGWLAAGIHVVTPNKQAGSGPLARYEAIRAAADASGARFRYEATVGAGLPVITTLRDLVDTGDTVTSIEGIFSGTLAWLFNKYDGSVPFAELVTQARSMGYTEPDPRDDLSGVDVARKLVILAREAGRAISLEDVQVESLVPAALRQSSVEDFMARLPEVDAAFAQRLANARARQRAALRGAVAAGPRAQRGPGRAAGRSCIRQLASDRQRRSIHHAPLLPEPAGGAGSGCGAGSDRSRRVRRSAARGGRRGCAAMSGTGLSSPRAGAGHSAPREARAFAPARWPTWRSGSICSVMHWTASAIR